MKDSKLHVIYAGEGFFPDDIKFLNDPDAIEIENIPSLGKLEHPASFAHQLKSCDLAIFKVNGAYEFVRYMETYKEIPLIQNLFGSTKFKKVLWSVDTHVMQELETHLTYENYFDKIYSAHSAFMRNFDSTKSAWLPCCYRLSSISELGNFNALEYPIERDVLFYYNPTPSGDRNETAIRFKSVCDKMRLRSLFGHVGNWGLFSQFIKTSRVCLNLSMNNDLNYRFFELQAFNAVQIADRVDDHDKISADWNGVFFVQRDASDLESTLEEALSKKISFNGSRYVTSQHMLIHRLVEIINQMTGTSLSVNVGF